jgi:plastocyanin
MKRLVVVCCLAALSAAVVVALAPAAAVPVYKGSVGPGFTIKLAKLPKKPGKAKIVVADLSSEHNFHLTGPGVNVSTTLGGKGTKTFTVTLKKGTYTFVCDPHRSFMKGSFRIR